MKYHYVCSHDNGFSLKKKLRDGKYIVYSKDNPKLNLIEGFYKNRRKDGKWFKYDREEKSTEYHTYERGRLTNEFGIDSLERVILDIRHTSDSIIGVYYSYHFLEQLRYKDEFRQSKNDKTTLSTATYFYKNDQVKSITRYKNGDGHGKSVKYYESGGLKMEFEWYNGNKVGVWKWWDEKGELTKEEDNAK